MRFRFLFLAMVGLGTITACGGGSAVLNPRPPATPTPSPVPTNGSSRPAAAGDAFNYAGTSQTTFVRPPQTYGAIPSPNPTNSQTLSYTVTQAQSVTANQTYNGTAGAFAFTTAESDTLLGGLVTTTATNTEYYAYIPSGASMLVRDLGGTTRTSAGNSFATLYGVGNGLVDVLSEVAGAIAPANNAAFMRSETDADGQTDRRATNADGSFTEALAYPDGTAANAAANVDGSGSYSLPSAAYGGQVAITFGAPTPNPSGVPVIPIVITFPPRPATSANPSPTPVVRMGNEAVWYPTPIALFHQTLANSGQAPIPAACNVPAALVKSSSNAVVTTTTTVDPIFGEFDVLATTDYTEPGVGVACVMLSDQLGEYYDYSLQTGFILAFAGHPYQTTTTTETLGLASETVLGLSSVSRTRASVGTTPMIAAASASFRSLLESRRAKRHADDLRALRANSLRLQGAR